MAKIATALANGTIDVLETLTGVKRNYNASRCHVITDPVNGVCTLYYEQQPLASIANDITLFPGNSIFGGSTVAALTTTLAGASSPIGGGIGGGGGGGGGGVDTTPNLGALTTTVAPSFNVASANLNSLLRLQAYLLKPPTENTASLSNPDTLLAGKFIKKLVFNNNSTTLLFIQFHLGASIISNGATTNLYFRSPPNSTLVIGPEFFGPAGTQFFNWSTTRIGVSTTANTYTSAGGALSYSLYADTVNDPATY